MSGELDDIVIIQRMVREMESGYYWGAMFNFFLNISSVNGL